jgi:epsilon-lactone hydrolase
MTTDAQHDGTLDPVESPAPKTDHAAESGAESGAESADSESADSAGSAADLVPAPRAAPSDAASAPNAPSEPSAPAARRGPGGRLLQPGGPPSAEARVVNTLIRFALKWVWAVSPDKPRTLPLLRHVIDAVARRPIPGSVHIERVDFGGFSGEWVRAGAMREGRAFLYLHGGGYFFGSRRMYRPLTWRLAAVTRRPVLAVDYRLMPDHTLDDARADAVAAYEALLDQGYAPADIVIGGDSAGGHLTLVTLMELRERGLPLPSAAVVLSPWADMDGAAPSRTANRRHDPLIPPAKLAWLGAYYADGRDPSDPMLSPVHGDYTGLPPLMVIYSASEILADDARRVVARARECGVEVRAQCWEGVIHAFPVFADVLPEGRAALRHIGRFLGN